MSWQTYVDNQLIGSGKVTAAAIIGHDGSVWAKSSTFPQFTPEEITVIMNGLAEPGSLFSTGFSLGGVKYFVIRVKPGALIRGGKDSGGVSVRKTGQALIIGIYDRPMQPQRCYFIVEELGDYLIDQGL
ncbi:hypothetical protein PTKIN_Ptkin03bG0203400 [Pterospermum kingtungense]